MVEATTLGRGPGPGLPEEPDGPGREWLAVVVRLLVAVLVLGGVYLGVALWFKDRPPAGVSVAGVDIGTMSRADAREHLRDSLAEQASSPVSIRVVPEGAPADSAEEIALDPARAGLSYDYDATLDQVTGFSLDPRVLWSHVARQERELPLVGVVDHGSLVEAVSASAEEYDEEPVEGDVSLGADGVEVVESREGRRLDVERTAAAVAAAWPESTSVEGFATSVPTTLDQAEIERLTSSEVEPALAGPVTVTATRGSGEDAEEAVAELAPREIVPLLSVERTDDSTLRLEVDEEGLLARLRQELGRLEQGPVDATVRLAGDAVKVVPGRAGAVLEEASLVRDVTAALGAEGSGRSVETTLRAVEPAIPTSASKEWVFEVMGSFSSVFPTGQANAARTANLRAAVRNLHGTVVMPGEQFALSAALGDITEENGYREAPIIVDGRLVMGMGGGLSQISTVVFNTSWSSGVQLDAHTPHSYYIPRYPAGREATLALPGLDNMWTNDTDNPVVIRAWITGDTIRMEYLGERRVTVQTVDGERRDVTRGERHVDDGPDCVPQAAAEGFTITNVRILLADGQEVGRDQFTTVYQPADEIVCTHPDAGY